MRGKGEEERKRVERDKGCLTGKRRSCCRGEQGKEGRKGGRKEGRKEAKEGCKGCVGFGKCREGEVRGKRQGKVKVR